MNRKQILSSRTLLVIILLVIAAGSGILAYYFYNKYQKIVQNPDAVVKKETEQLVGKVSKLMELPKDETPSIATVIDEEKLKDQLFFSKAENGDKVLVYIKAKKAILYRPSIHKIIEVAPLKIEETQEDKSKEKEQILKVALYNGSNIVGLANSAEEKLKEKFSNLKIVTKENAKKKDYAETIVVDLSGDKKTQAEEIAKILEGETSPLPEGEIKPEADILVIVAK